MNLSFETTNDILKHIWNDWKHVNLMNILFLLKNYTIVYIMIGKNIQMKKL